MRTLEAEKPVPVARGCGLRELVLRNRVTSGGDPGLDRYISSIPFKLARGRGHLELALPDSSHSCGLPAISDRAAWPTVTTQCAPRNQASRFCMDVTLDVYFQVPTLPLWSNYSRTIGNSTTLY